MVKTQTGFSTVEVLLAAGLLGLIVTAAVGSLIIGVQSVALAGTRGRAAFFANEGIEAVRSIRDASFSNLVNGTYGLAVSGSRWVFSGTADTSDIFTRQVMISDSTVSASFKLVTAVVTWAQTSQRAGSMTLATELTNWSQSAPAPSSCAAYCASLGTYTTGVCRQSAAQCTLNGETHVAGGDAFCTSGGNPRCCCF